jgi:DNA-directed RNA polymerase subunit M/transcription elongation factor TFIIS
MHKQIRANVRHGLQVCHPHDYDVKLVEQKMFEICGGKLGTNFAMHNYCSMAAQAIHFCAQKKTLPIPRTALGQGRLLAFLSVASRNWISDLWRYIDLTVSNAETLCGEALAESGALDEKSPNTQPSSDLSQAGDAPRTNEAPRTNPAGVSEPKATPAQMFDGIFGQDRCGQRKLNVCHKCRIGDVTYDQKQVRSLDEGATTFFLCLGCNHQWRSN